METVAGVFRSYEMARTTAGLLRGSGFAEDRVTLLYPGSTEKEIHSIATSDTEQPGVGAAIGGVVGATVGMAGGFELGVAATALIPGVGPVIAAGIAGAALLGAGGLAAGAELGSKQDRNSTEGVPVDELYFYEDALRQGRSLVVTFVDGPKEKERAETIMKENGAESIDAARESWWVGLRDDEREHYEALGENFELDQGPYRQGFEAGLRRACQGKTVEEAADCLKWWYPDTWDTKPFHRGYERGQRFCEQGHRELARK